MITNIFLKTIYYIVPSFKFNDIFFKKFYQGMNDLVTPFFLVFLRDGLQNLGQLNPNEDHGSNFVPADLEVESLPLEMRQSVEADSFWCLSVVMDGIQDNYSL